MCAIIIPHIRRRVAAGGRSGRVGWMEFVVRGDTDKVFKCWSMDICVCVHAYARDYHIEGVWLSRAK